ncbi:hypothetical protein K2Z83_13835 [Oscillochloris sp. ZM17-4]|uniref:slr1658 superfamily regulator n=1 Tax=Oscillochloris sp. ZM17-4 TaxID=2866714 RepID=UPI001C739403|nr:hypothetical protein [Oscillochloris sp. ZM17-4]MBX0328755.1 hypothetical protein [Oscillochloris sp. ZM17-4]
MSTATETLGAWEDLAGAAALSHQRMDLDAAQLEQYWRRCSLSADFWSRYTALFVPGDAPRGRLSQNNLAHVLSYLLNELFENCAKFSDGPIRTVRYECVVRPDDLVFTLTNHIAPERQPGFARFVGELLSADLEALYIQRLEESVESGAGGSGLGYLTLMKDYGIRFGFGFAPAAEGSVAVTVQAHVQLEEH